MLGNFFRFVCPQNSHLTTTIDCRDTVFVSGMKFYKVSILTACFAVASNGKKDVVGSVTENYDYNGDELASMERMIKTIPNESVDYDVTTSRYFNKRPNTIILPDSSYTHGNGSTFDSYWDMSSEGRPSDDCARSSGSSSDSNDTSGMYLSEKFSSSEQDSELYDIQSYEIVTDRRGDPHLMNRILRGDEGKTDVNANVRDDGKRSKVRAKDAGEKVETAKSKRMTKAVGRHLSSSNHLRYARDFGIPPNGRLPKMIKTSTAAPGRSFGSRKLRTISVRIKV